MTVAQDEKMKECFKIIKKIDKSSTNDLELQELLKKLEYRWRLLNIPF